MKHGNFYLLLPDENGSYSFGKGLFGAKVRGRSLGKLGPTIWEESSSWGTI